MKEFHVCGGCWCSVLKCGGRFSIIFICFEMKVVHFISKQLICVAFRKTKKKNKKTTHELQAYNFSGLISSLSVTNLSKSVTAISPIQTKGEAEAIG